MSLNGTHVPGERLRVTAQDWNDIAATVRKVRDLGRESSDLGAPVQSAMPRGVAVVRIRNQTGASLERFAVVGIDAPAITPADDLNAFRQEIILNGIAPVAGTHEGKCAILLLPLESGEVGPAVVSGVVQCRLTVSGSLEDWAEIANGVTGSLTNGASGSARVLWAETSGSERWAIVRLGNAAPSLGLDTVDGSPSYSPTTTIRLDEADGFSLSQPSAGVVRVDILAATASQAGIVSTSGQAWTGNKDCETGVSSPYLKSGYYNPSVPTVFPQDVSADNLPGLHLQDDRTATPSESGVVPHAAVGLARILDQPAGSKSGGQLLLRVRNTSGSTATVSLCADSGANGVFLWDGSYWIYSGGSLKQGVSYSDFNGNVFTGGIVTASRPWRPYKGY